MSGQVVSEPYRSEDWSGKGRTTCTTFSRVTGISKTTARAT